MSILLCFVEYLAEMSKSRVVSPSSLRRIYKRVQSTLELTVLNVVTASCKERVLAGEDLISPLERKYKRARSALELIVKHCDTAIAAADARNVELKVCCVFCSKVCCVFWLCAANNRIVFVIKEDVGTPDAGQMSCRHCDTALAAAQVRDTEVERA